MQTRVFRGVKWVESPVRSQELEAWEAPTIGGRIALCRDSWGAFWTGAIRGEMMRCDTFDAAQTWCRVRRRWN